MQPKLLTCVYVVLIQCLSHLNTLVVYSKPRKYVFRRSLPPPPPLPLGHSYLLARGTRKEGTGVYLESLPPPFVGSFRYLRPSKRNGTQAGTDSYPYLALKVGVSNIFSRLLFCTLLLHVPSLAFMHVESMKKTKAWGFVSGWLSPPCGCEDNLSLKHNNSVTPRRRPGERGRGNSTLGRTLGSLS